MALPVARDYRLVTVLDSHLVRAQQALGYTFNSIELLKEALTHSSILSEMSPFKFDNKSLEYFGDGIWGRLVHHLLSLSNVPADRRFSVAQALSTDVFLSDIADQLGLGKLLIRAGVQGDREWRWYEGQPKAKLLRANALEALMAAIFMDQQKEADRFPVVWTYFHDKILPLIRADLQQLGVVMRESGMADPNRAPPNRSMQHRLVGCTDVIHITRKCDLPPPVVIASSDPQATLCDYTRSHWGLWPRYEIKELPHGQDQRRRFRLIAYIERLRMGQGESEHIEAARNIAAKAALEIFVNTRVVP
jgi:dsRNA-specific ribonuclease